MNINDIQTVKDVMKFYGCARETAEEMLPRILAERHAVNQKAMAEKPAKRAEAQAIYDAELTKGGKNAERRAIRAAREIMSDFRAPGR